MEWQPIETAPKDWNCVMLFEASDDEPFSMYVGYWNGDYWIVPYDDFGNHLPRPTHWMPLPDPPKLKTEDKT